VNGKAAVVLLLALACSRQAPGEVDAQAPSLAESALVPPAASPGAGPGAGGSPTATIKLLDAGRSPRRKLRYTWHAERREMLAVDLRTATSTETPGNPPTEIPLPPLHIVIAIDPRSVTADAGLAYAWHVTSATVADTQETPSEVADGMRTEVSAIAHLSGSAQVNSRGLATDVSVDADSVTDAGATGQMVEQVRQILRDLAAPLPEEDVGLGARWQKLSQLASKDAQITQTDTLSLLDLAGQKGTLDDVLAQTAPAQALATPGGTANRAQARLESMLASGDAKTHFDLSRLAPETSFEGTTTMVVSSHSSADPPRRLTMIMRIGIVLAGSMR
jgi:hypothetical protein